MNVIRNPVQNTILYSVLRGQYAPNSLDRIHEPAFSPESAA